MFKEESEHEYAAVVLKTFSVRNPLQGDLSDFLDESGFPLAEEKALVRDLTCLLASYREEDVAVFPEVFLVRELTTLAALAPGTAPLRIRTAKRKEVTAERVLKECSTIAVNGWAVFVGCEDVSTYGVFRAQKHTLSESAASTLQGGTAPDLPCLRLKNTGRNVVQLQNSKNDVFTAALTSDVPSGATFQEHVSVVSKAISMGVAEDRFEMYAHSFLGRVLQGCHGTLVAVVKPSSDPPTEFSDSVWLSAPLNWAEKFALAASQQTADALADLQSIEALLVGMINSDGVVVLGTAGTVLGFRAFLKPSASEQTLASEGGGRMRTFHLMKHRIGVGLVACMFRSQDGKTNAAGGC